MKTAKVNDKRYRFKVNIRGNYIFFDKLTYTFVICNEFKEIIGKGFDTPQEVLLYLNREESNESH